MNRISRYKVVALLAVGLVATPGSDVSAQQDKLAQTGMKFLSISVDARATGMANAVTAVEGGGESLFYNPAAMGWQEGSGNVAFGRTMWIADIDYDYFSASFVPGSGQYGVFATSLMFAQYGELQETIRFNNEQGFLDVGTFKPRAWAAGLGYAKAVTDRFSVGGQVKYVQQDLGNSIVDFQGETGYLRSDNSEGVVAFDLGMLYRTGFRSLNFAVSARNFSAEVEYEEESFQLPLTLMIGVSMDMFDLVDFSENQSFHVSVDAVNPRDFSEQIKLGAEYRFMDILALRAGYAFPTDEEGISFGGGVTPSLGSVGLAVDYSYTDFGVFSEVQRLTLKFKF